MTQTKADRQAAAQKAAATRRRNEVREESRSQGHKAASTRQGRSAKSGIDQARGAAGGAVKGLGSAAKLAGGAAVSAGKSVASRAASLTAGRR